jgi:RHS repeat-associated protein
LLQLIIFLYLYFVQFTTSNTIHFSSNYHATFIHALKFFKGIHEARLGSVGMVMPGRSYASESYRYGFNGMEKDPEGMGGGGSTYDYGFRIFNPQLGRFLSVDPLTASYPMLTPFQYASNTPIQAIDLDGLEAVNAQSININELGKSGIKKETSDNVILFTHTWMVIPFAPQTISFKFYINGTSLNQIKAAHEEGGWKGVLSLAWRNKDYFLLEHGDELKNSQGLAYPLDALGTAFRQFTNEDASASHGVAVNTYRHIFGQALLTILYGENFAKYVGDAHERDGNGFINATESYAIADSYADIINNYYGRELGKQFMEENGLKEGTEWTNELTAKFMNFIGDYTLKSFEEHKRKKSNFKETDVLVIELTKAINNARD